MKKKIVMALYGAPGTSKSTFASKAPNPFFIATDGNFSWLGLPKKNHVQITNFEQFKKIVELLTTGSPMFAEFETIVVDLADDVAKYAENDFLKKNGIQYIGDMDYGKGYRIVRDTVEIEMLNKLISVDKNIIFLLHEKVDTSEKDIRGNTLQKYVPIFDEKLLDKLEGRVQFFLRAFKKSEIVEDGQTNKVTNKYYISLIPKNNEYGIARNIDEDNTPDEIESDWDTFMQAIGLADEIGYEEDEPETELQALIGGIVAPVKKVAPRPGVQQPAVAPTTTTVAKPTTVVKTATTVAKPTTVAKTAPTVAKPTTVDVDAIEKKIASTTAKSTTTVARPTTVAKTATTVKSTIKKEDLVEEEPTQEEVVEEVANAEDLSAKVDALNEIQSKAEPVVAEENKQETASVKDANAALKALLAKRKKQ